MKLNVEPQIDEIRLAREIGKAPPSSSSGTKRYKWVACIDCGFGRWVACNIQGVIYQKHPQTRCQRCSSLFRKGKNTANFVRGYYLLNGYKCIPNEDELFLSMNTRRGHILEHRLVMAQSIGRCLGREEVVHHKNGVKDDNRLENLELLSNAGVHIKEHSQGYWDGYRQGIIDGRNQIANNS